jgi:outer membrane receptor protein involved in Fe transport
MIAVYANDTWQLTDRLRIDAGFRQEWYNMVSNAAATATFNYGDATTLADNSARAFTGAIVNNTFNTTATNWTVGANYDFAPSLGLYARASRLEIPISAGTMINVAPVTDATNANQYEVGIKAQLRGSYLYLTGFYTKFSPLNSSFAQYNPATGRNDQSVKFIGDVVTKGIEADGHLKLNSIFYIDASATVQNPQYKNLTAASSVDLSQIFGNQIIRDPKIYGHVRPSADFQIAGARTSIYGNWAFVGRRFVDANMLTALPAYSTFGAGIIVKAGTWRFQVVGDNLTNAHGLTEGNTRTDAISGQGTPTAVYGRPVFGRNFRFVLSKSW